ncbi:hypothetical protein RSAG8_03698, partial [Rhizoctonia solani AG-8 WAC10335]
MIMHRPSIFIFSLKTI